MTTAPLRRTLLAVSVVLLVVAGVGSAAYVLTQERLRTPLRDVYHVNVEVSAADGVAPGLGQPVEVAGIKVGTISDARLNGGRAVVTLEIERSRLRTVHTDARVALQPVTPLKDMQVELDPGSDSAPALRDGGTIAIARSSTPAGLDEMLAALDTDSRAFLTAFIGASDEGTRGRASSIRRMLLALGPTVDDARAVTRQLDLRRHRLARLVHNLAIITRAAAQDRRLTTFVAAGDEALRAIARQSTPLRVALTRLPRTLAAVDRTLGDTASFSRTLVPTLRALTPATRRLPSALPVAGTFSSEAAAALRRQIRPLVRESQPLLDDLGPALTQLDRTTPALTGAMRGVNYLLNELGYNPPGDDEGFLFWFPWWFHNYTSMFSSQDAHGSAARAMIVTNCQGLTNLASAGDVYKAVLGVYSACSGGGG